MNSRSETPVCAGDGIRVMLAEDEDLMRTYIARMLKMRGYEVAPVANGREALDQFESFAPDIIITDLEMPVLDGMQLIETLREEHPDFPIIVVTAFSDEQHRAPGATMSLSKPILFHQLLAGIDRCLGRVPEGH